MEFKKRRRTQPNPFPAQFVPQPEVPFSAQSRATSSKTPWKPLVFGFVVLNLALAVVWFACTTLLVAKQTAQQMEQKRVLNRHPLYFKEDIISTATRYNLQPAFVSAIINRESSFKTDARSNVGALGLMQLMPDTAEWISQKLNDSNFHFENLSDPTTNIEYGCWYLSFLAKRFNGDPILTVAAYHAGQGQVGKWLKNPSISQDEKTISIDNLSEGPTKTYVKRVLESYAIYQTLYFKNY